MAAKAESRFVIIGGIVVISLIFMIVMTLILMANISTSVAKKESIQAISPTVTEQSIYFELPLTFPRDMPFLPRARITSALENKDDWSAVFLTGSTVEAAVDFYSTELPKKGWEITDQSSAAGITIFYVTREDKEGIVTIGRGEGGVTVSITILKS